MLGDINNNNEAKKNLHRKNPPFTMCRLLCTQQTMMCLLVVDQQSWLKPGVVAKNNIHTCIYVCINGKLLLLLAIVVYWDESVNVYVKQQQQPQL